MASIAASTQDVLGDRVNDALLQANGQVEKLRKTDFRLAAASFVSSAAGTIVAGVTAAGGPVVGEGIPGWRLACLVAAGLSFGATALTGVARQLKLGDRRATALQCVGRLKGLEAALAIGSRPREEVAREYEEVVRIFPEVVG